MHSSFELIFWNLTATISCLYITNMSLSVFASPLLFLSPLYRLKKGKQLEKEEAINEVKKNIHLIKAPHAGKICLVSILPSYTQES